MKKTLNVYIEKLFIFKTFQMLSIVIKKFFFFFYENVGNGLLLLRVCMKKFNI